MNRNIENSMFIRFGNESKFGGGAGPATYRSFVCSYFGENDMLPDP